MSRRPLPDDALQVIQRASMRMAPGGLMWSESPIPRPGRRRVARHAAAAPYDPLLTAGGASYAAGITYGYPEPPSDQYLTSAKADPIVLDQGHALVVLIAGYELGSIGIPTGWHTAASGTVGSTPLQYALVYITDADGSVDGTLTYSGWDATDSAAIVADFTWTSDDPYTVSPLPAWSWDLQVSVATDSGVNGIAAQAPSTAWIGRHNITVGLVENAVATSYPYIQTDPTIDYTGRTGVSDGLGGADRVSVVWPYDGDHTPLATPTTFEFTSASATGAWVSLGIGWA